MSLVSVSTSIQVHKPTQERHTHTQSLKFLTLFFCGSENWTCTKGWRGPVIYNGDRKPLLLVKLYFFHGAGLHLILWGKADSPALIFPLREIIERRKNQRSRDGTASSRTAHSWAFLHGPSLLCPGHFLVIIRSPFLCSVFRVPRIRGSDSGKRVCSDGLPLPWGWGSHLKP